MCFGAAGCWIWVLCFFRRVSTCQSFQWREFVISALLLISIMARALWLTDFWRSQVILYFSFLWMMWVLKIVLFTSLGFFIWAGAIVKTGSNKQVLDKLQVERERGITVKAQTASLFYQYDGQKYLLNLIDTPVRTMIWTWLLVN